MNCKAYMEENSEDNTFGMEAICFVDGTGADRMQHSNYRYCVGSNLKPKMVKPGRILVKLKSQKFEANVEAGEEEKMEKEEPDFRGRDFEKQFSCIFKKDMKTNIDRGTFGKVVLDRIGENRQRIENLFEFNLNKTGIETEASPPDNTDSWSCIAIKELAGNLDLLEEERMKQFASYIGFTRHEIKMSLTGSSAPFKELMNMYQQRGGKPEEFVQALYAVSRDFNMSSSGCGSNKSGGTPQSTTSGVSGSGSQQSLASQESGIANIHRRLSFLNPWRNNDSDSGTADMHPPPDMTPSSKAQAGLNKDCSTPPQGHGSLQASGMANRKRTRPKEHRTMGSAKRRRFAGTSFKGSYKYDDSYSSSDESGQEDNRREKFLPEVKSVSTEKHLTCSLQLSDQDLWSISSQMNAIKWRALGRTLG